MSADPEHIVTLAHEARWADAWRAVHAVGVPEDERMAWAVATLADAFFDRVETGPMTDDLAGALETVVLLHSGGLYRLTAERFEAAVTQLVAYHRATGDAQSARRYARFCPDAPPCATALEDTAAPSGDGAGGGAVPDARASVETTALDHPLADTVDVTVTEPLTAADRATGLFRSPMEQAFYQAARDVFPTYTPVPNVALKAVVDADALAPHLTGDERSLLHTALVDCVLVDPQADHRPVAFFELDSRHHDAPDRRANDARKNRILARAGHRLVRLRPHTQPVTPADFARILRALPLTFAPTE